MELFSTFSQKVEKRWSFFLDVQPKTMKLFFAVLTLDLHARGIDIGVNMGKGDDKRTSELHILHIQYD